MFFLLFFIVDNLKTTNGSMKLTTTMLRIDWCTLFMVFIVTYYVELCNAIDSYYTCHCIPKKIKEFVSTLYKVNDFFIFKVPFLAKSCTIA